MERTYVHFRYLVSEKTKAKNTCIAARLIWQLVIRSCVIFPYIISRKDGENNGLLNSLSLPFQMPATQASLHGLRTADVFPVVASLPSLWRERSDDRKYREKWKRVLDVLASLACSRAARFARPNRRACNCSQAKVLSMSSDGEGCRDLRPLIRSRCKGVLKQDNEWKGELSCVT